MAEPSGPFLLYVYPWMPYPRRVLIYLAEKGIPSSLVTVVSAGNFPGDNINATPGYPPPPPGSLPVLRLPKTPAPDTADELGYTHIRQTSAIINYLEDMCESGAYGFPKSGSMRGSTPLERARNEELLGLAEESLNLWNPLRMTGSKMQSRAEGSTATTNAAVSKDIWGLLMKRLEYVEKFLGERNGAGFGLDSGNRPSIVDVTLFAFLEFVDGFYGRDVTAGFERLRAFFWEFGGRESVTRTFVEYPHDMAEKARDWNAEVL